ncbi:JK_53P [Escherichia phage Jk06]|uniref:JK_53P n=1 Tax=Escherichia phage Jk06 TaxID=2886922 RepID=Q45PW3_9CAUD|nr:hypothetical protein JK_53 [Escherichia phage Jk06]AAZ29303.1 JK_53P [Escherichia phage Jk06]
MRARPSGVVSDTGNTMSQSFSSLSSSSSFSSNKPAISEGDFSCFISLARADSLAIIFLRSRLRRSFSRSVSAIIGARDSELMADLPVDGGWLVTTYSDVGC